MSYQYIYVMKHVNKVYAGNKEVLKNIHISFLPGAKIGVVGYNGAGKSTLLRIMAGIDKDFSGEAWAAQGTRIGYLEQEPKLNNNKNVGDNILEAFADKLKLLKDYQTVSEKFAEELSAEEMDELIAEQSKLQEQIDACNAWDLEREVDIAIDALRCPPKEAKISELSGGEKRRVALCRLLLEKPDLLLLDEPTNHLDAESVAWLEKHLREYPGTIVMVTHDRYFLDNVTKWILELDRGEGIPWEGNYSSWLEQKEKHLSQIEKTESNIRKQLQSELEWIRQSPKARQAKGKARLNSYDALQSRPQRENVGVAQIVIPNGPRLGNMVINVNSLYKSQGDKLLIENLSLSIPPAAIVGIIGPNGAGKTTLLKMFTGQEKPDSGEVIIGDTVVMGYVDQSRDSLNDNKTVWEEISNGLDEMPFGTKTVKSRAYCSAFNFKGTDQQMPVGQLSGGQRNRVHLAKMLKTGANVILLDEPTNDLDVDTLRALEEGLQSFSGCAIVVSHDRWFLDRLATHIIAFEGDSHVEWFAGNYQSYEEDRMKRLGSYALMPTKIKYKSLRKN